MVLLIEYFTPNNPIRDIEYKTSILENLKNPFIELIKIFISDDSELDINSPKIQIIKLESRPTFRFLFDYCNDNLQNQICIIANTDIILDESLSILRDSNLENTFLALTRWDLINQRGKWMIQFYDHPWKEEITTGMLSQDTWIFKSPIKTDPRLEFLMGKPGCDNRIGQIFFELGLKVKNPSKQIITKHFHQSNWRTYNSQDIIMGPYLLITPNGNIGEESYVKTIQGF